MKKYLIALLIGCSLLCLRANAQTGDGEQVPVRRVGRGGGFGGGIGGRMDLQEQAIADTNAINSLPRFDLDFPGGRPKELVAAIQKASGKPLNVIIQPEDASVELPPLTVKGVNVFQIFQALEQASEKQEPYVTGYNYGPGTGRNPTYTFVTTGYGFRTTGTPSENSIWYFRWNKLPSVPLPEAEPSRAPQVCGYYYLGPYLDAGYKVEDITTAIETGWKMLNETNPPKMSYHKDTKLLIAVGRNDSRLGMIQDVLNHLPTTPPKRHPAEAQPSGPN